jgi:iron complex outermembrane receptor protein
MYVSYYNGNQAIVSYHGTTDQHARRMQVLVDGRSVYLQPVGEVVWEDLPLLLEDIERIEVIRGPAAASHGGNSTQGVINIITREAATVKGFQATVRQGNKGANDLSLQAGNHGESVDYRMSLGYRADNGYDANRVDIANDSYATRVFNVRGNYHPNLIDNIDFQLGYNTGVRGAGYATSKLNTPHDLLATSSFEQITWQHNADASEVSLRWFHIDHDVQNSTAINNVLSGLPPPPPSYIISDNISTRRDDIELQHTLNTSRDNRFVWGASVRQDSTRAPSQFSSDQILNQSTLFAHDEWHISPKWITNLGAMLEDGGIGSKHVSPRAALSYHLDEQNTFRAGLSRAYRYPSLFEELANYHFLIGPIPQLGGASIPVQEYLASGGLRPEKTLSREIGYFGQFHKDLSLDLRAFRDQSGDIIWITQTNPMDFRNQISAVESGLEGTLKYAFGWQQHVTLNLSHQTIVSNFPAYADIVPKNSGSVMYGKRFDSGFTFDLNYYQQGTLQPFDRTSVDRQLLSRRVDMRFSQTVKTAHGNIELSLVVQAPLDGSYIDYMRENQFTRRVFMTLGFMQ